MVGESNRDGRDSKKAKKKSSNVDDGISGGAAATKTRNDAKKQLFQRLQSEKDEIAVLKGMIEYTAKKGADPVADMTAFHDFIKSKLQIDVSKTQLSDKVGRLKTKYKDNAGEGKEGEERSLSKPHDQKAYQLSKMIWAGEANSVERDSTMLNGIEKMGITSREVPAWHFP